MLLPIKPLLGLKLTKYALYTIIIEAWVKQEIYPVWGTLYRIRKMFRKAGGTF